MIDERRLADWSDWSEPGGRWSSVMEGSALRYSDDPEAFNQVVNDFIESTQNEVIRIVKEIGHLSIDELVSDPRYSFASGKGDEDDESPSSEEEEPVDLSEDEVKRRQMKRMRDAVACYNAIRVLEITQDRFTPDTHFFDLEVWSADRGWLNERIENKPEQQFLVMWDFHY